LRNKIVEIDERGSSRRSDGVSIGRIACDEKSFVSERAQQCEKGAETNRALLIVIEHEEVACNPANS